MVKNIPVVLKMLFQKSEEHEGFKIFGSPKFILQTKEILGFLKESYQSEFDVIQRNVKNIVESKKSGGVAKINPSILKIDLKSAFFSKSWYAALLYREARVMERLEKNEYNKSDRELEQKRATQEQMGFLEKLKAPQEEIEYLSKL